MFLTDISVLHVVSLKQVDSSVKGKLDRTIKNMPTEMFYYWNCLSLKLHIKISH